MRVVLDTNVLISDLLSSKGAPGRILDAWRVGGFELIVCDELIDEFKRVCAYPKLARYLTVADVGALINRLRAVGCWLADIPRVQVSKDADDNFLLAMGAGFRSRLPGNRRPCGITCYRSYWAHANCDCGSICCGDRMTNGIRPAFPGTSR